MSDEIGSHDTSVTASEELEGPHRRSRTLGPGTVLAERYQIEGLLGRGGMGVVMRAHDRILGLDIAIKLLREDLETDRRWSERLAREVKTARLVRHPNVCRVFDFQHAEGQAFIVMELAKGTLADELGNEQSVVRSLEARIADVRAIVAGLAAIHGAGIVHRDVSTRNILRLADERLVLSDLGLAIDVGDVPATLQGGTVAYMAPELAAGGRASVATDMWALGIVIYEIVFGARPSWRGDTLFRGIDRPARRLTSAEEVLFAVCRDCTAVVPTARPRSAAELLDRLDTGRRPRRFRARYLFAGAALVAITAGVLGFERTRGQRASQPLLPATDAPLEPNGEPQDWTDTSRIVATVPDKIDCMVPLPDDHTARVVWGRPSIAEDIDIKTGERRRSPLVPAAYANGCPDLSADGRTLIFQGYDGEGRPGIFESSHPDGSDARFLVPAADPSMLSEPRWFADGSVFVFDADDRHIGVFDRSKGRSSILPLVITDDNYSIFRSVSGNRVFVFGEFETGSYLIDSISWPTLAHEGSFTVKGVNMEWEGRPDGRTFYAPESAGTALVEVDTYRHRVSRLGVVRKRFLHLPRVIGSVLVFVGGSELSDVWIPTGKTLRQVTFDGTVNQAARCANGDFLAAKRDEAGHFEFGRFGGDGYFRRLFTGMVEAPACSKKTNDWWYTDSRALKPVTYHCAGDTCTVIGNGYLVNALSPDETRIASVAVNNRGLYVQWIPSHGGPAHHVAASETNCPPVWASNTTLWVSRRRGARVLWTEFDADTGVETGQTRPAGSDCSDGSEDPLFPPDPDVRIIKNRQSEVRVLPLTEVRKDGGGQGA